MSTTDPQQPEPVAQARTRTPAQAAAWDKVERERATAAPRQGVPPVVVVRVVIGVLMAVAALTTFFVMAPDDSDDRRDALLVIGLIGAGAALATSGAGRRTVEPPG